MTEVFENLSSYKNAASLLTAMANSKRLLILSLLIKDEIPVGQLAQLAGLSQSALSQHLSKLRSQRLVRTRRSAQTIYYSCSSEAVRSLLVTLDGLFAIGAPPPREVVEEFAKAG